MAEKGQSGDRTEAATPRRIQKAREAGQIPISREVGAFASLAAVVAALALYEPHEVVRWIRHMAALLTQSGRMDAVPTLLIRDSAFRLLEPIWLPLLAACVSGAGAILLQSRGLLHPEWAQPKLERVSPASGLKRIFGVAGLVEFGKSMLKLLVFGALAYLLVRHDVATLSLLPFAALSAQTPMLGQTMLHLLYAALLTQGLSAGIDFGWVIFRHFRGLRMSKQDIRDEFKETEGNPQTKARIRRIRALRARRRMMSRV
ncbi:MAG: EscU/YscU/HrcU family type III secretion system export apparatus switch protein, partial [Rhodospirillales bacterium]|nr:EscU/YscU/HrcU family type III secretion system export apparatus switch protein [Acetobacter sp.]